MHVYLSTSPNGDVFTEWTSTYRNNRDEGLPQFVWKNITYGNYADNRVINFDIDFPDARCSLLTSKALILTLTI